MNDSPLIARTAVRFAAILHRYRWVGFLVGIASLGPLAWLQSGLQMNRQLSSMFADHDASLIDYQEMQSIFGGNLVVMIVYDDPELMTPDGLQRCRAWTQRVESLDSVEGVLSVANLVDVFAYLRPKLPFVSDDSIALFNREDSVANEFRDLFEGYTHGEKEQTAAIVTMLRPDGIERAVADLRQVVADMNSQEPQFDSVLVGEPILLQDAFDLILADGRRLAVGTIVLLGLVILLTLGDVRVVLLSAIGIVWSTLATRAFMVMLGIELSLVSAVLIAIIAVIVVAAVMHIGVGNVVRLIRNRTSGNESQSDSPTIDTSADQSDPMGVRVKRTFALLCIPIAVTCLTDAAGFASLLVSDVRPVRQFGIMTATASIAVMLSLALFAPTIMSWSDRLRVSPIRLLRRSAHRGAATPRTDSFHRQFLRRIVGWSIHHRVSLGLVSLMLILICGIHVSSLETNSSFLKNFRDDSPIVTAYRRVEDRMGGAGVMDVVLPAPDRISSDYLNQVLAFEERLRALQVGLDDVGQNEIGKLSKVLSLADADRVAAEVTLLSFVSPDVRLAGMRAAIPEFANALLTFPDAETGARTEATSSSRFLRIMLRSDEAMTAANKTALATAIDREVAAFESDAVPDSQFQPVLTGYSVLMSHLVASLVRDQWRALGTAWCLVGLLLWVGTGRWRETLAALLVNTLPIVVVLSLTGALGGQLDLGSAMIGAVSIGLSIDGSVHFLAGYHRRRILGALNRDAAIESASDLGLPIMLASVALVVGFGVLVTSPFVPTATFGLLVATTLAASTIANLTLLPAMIVWWSEG